MQIFEIDYSFIVNMNDIEKSDIDSEQKTKPDFHEIQMNIHFGADCISDALTLAEEYLDNALDGEYYIESVSKMPGVDVVNWPGETECECSFCKALRSADEDVMLFDCSCGYQIRVMDDWKEIVCPDCHRTIARENIVSANGLYVFIDKG